MTISWDTPPLLSGITPTADGTTLARARSPGLDPVDHLDRNDACVFFARFQDRLVTGPR